MDKNKKKTRSVLKNGGILLEELIALFDGKSNPICCFTSDQILKATDNFSERRVIPEGKLYVEALVKGIVGFVDPDYMSTMKVTEKVDIYSFGVVMLVLLFGRTDVFYVPNKTHMLLKEYVYEAIERGDFEEIVDKEIWNASGDDKVTIQSQVEAFLILALRCVRHETYEPVSSMIEVAKELKLIEKLS